MKNIVKATALSLSLAFATGFAVAEENIAYINAGYLFQNHPDRQAVAEKLDSEFKDPAQKLQADKKAIDGKIASLQKDAPKLRSADIKKREDEINKLIKEHDKKVQQLQMNNEKRQNEESQKILESIQTATNSVAKAKGYTYVLDANSVAYAAEGKDITEEVLKAIPAAKADKPAEAPKADEAKAEAK